MALTPCRRCSRHVRSREARCPFCAAPLHRASVALSLGASALALGCNDPPRPAVPVAEVASIAPADAAPGAPPASSEIATSPDADAAAALDAAGPTASSAPDAGLALRGDPDGTMMGALYGGPPTAWGTPTGIVGLGVDASTPRIVGDVSASVTSASAPVPNAERVVAATRPRFRACYNAGLASDPNMAGVVSVVVAVDSAGEVDGVTIAGNTGLSAQAAECMAAAIKRSYFAAPGGTGAKLGLSIACSKRAH